MASDFPFVESIFFGEVQMGKPAVSRDAFRGLLAFHAAKPHHSAKPRGGYLFVRLFGHAEDVPDALVLQWSDKSKVLASETVGQLMDPLVREIPNGNAQYDHASDFLHRLLRDFGQKLQ